jgi:hypothetical protein
MRVNLINVLAQLASRLCLNFLYFLEATGLYKSAFGFKVGGEYFRELSAYVGQNVVRSKLEEGFKSRQVCAHLNDMLK